jgi:hypothetical protein
METKNQNCETGPAYEYKGIDNTLTRRYYIDGKRINSYTFYKKHYKKLSEDTILIKVILSIQ